MKFLKAVTVAIIAAGSHSPAPATTWSDKQIQFITADTRPCIFFQLVGVTQADPVVPTNPWFALSTSNPMFQQISAMLLTAKATQGRVDIITTGTGDPACAGYASVGGVWLK